jgi:hypothetical protein
VTAAGRPCSPIAAVTVARSLVGCMTYWLGTGDCDTPAAGKSDCAGFAINRCYGLRRHRRGFNVGPWASVEDDLNCNSAIEDADHRQELFVRARRPELGDLLAYPTFTVKDGNGTPHRFIGHIAIITGVSRMLEWDAARPQWHLLDVAQCAGPNGRTPGVLATDARHWDDHDRTFPKPEHRSVLLRPIP